MSGCPLPPSARDYDAYILLFQYFGDLELHHPGAARRRGDAREVESPRANICRGGGSLVRDAGHRPPHSPALGGVTRTTRFLRGVELCYRHVVRIENFRGGILKQSPA